MTSSEASRLPLPADGSGAAPPLGLLLARGPPAQHMGASSDAPPFEQSGRSGQIMPKFLMMSI
jgi:hypothetical protein